MAGLGTPSLYIGLSVIILLFSYSGGFHTSEIGPFSVRFKFFLLLFIFEIACFHIFSNLIAIIFYKVVVGNIYLGLLTSIPVAIAGALVNDPIVVLVSDLEHGILEFDYIMLNFFIAVPLFIISFGYHVKTTSAYFHPNIDSETPSTQENLKKGAVESFGEVDTHKLISTNSPIYLEAENHTVKIVFDGHVLIKRTKFTAEMHKWRSFGFQVHKSFWVNSHKIERRERIGRQLYLILKTGQKIPVGRSFEKDIPQFASG